MGDDPLARCGISQGTTRSWSFAEDVRRYAELGVAGIGVWLHKLEPEWPASPIPLAILEDALVERAAATVAEAGLRVSHVVAAGFYTDPASYEARVAHTRFAIDAARRLEARYLIVVPGRLGDRPREQALEATVSALGEVLPHAERAGVSLAIEPVSEVDFVNTLAEAVELVERLEGHPSLGICFDPFHLWRGDGLYEELARAAGRIVGVHLSDRPLALTPPGPRLAPGDGELPLRALVDALEEAGFDGWYDAEVLSPTQDEAEVARRCAEAMAALVGARA